MKLALLYREPVQGQTDDEDVLAQAAWIRTCLEPRGWQVHDVVCPTGGEWMAVLQALEQLQPTVVFNLVEGWPGDDRHQALIPGLLQAVGWPCTGSSTSAIYATTDKLMTKALLRAEGLPTPEGATYRGGDWIPTVYPSFCKPAWQDASLGIDDASVLLTPEDAARELPKRWQQWNHQPVLVEAFVPGREFNVSLWERPDGAVEALPPAELCFVDWPAEKPRIVNYAAKWNLDSLEYQRTQRFFVTDAALAQALVKAAQACWDVFQLAGYARVDFRQDAQGELKILEVNANPCLAPDAGFMAAVAQAGYLAADILEHMIQAALRQKAVRA